MWDQLNEKSEPYELNQKGLQQIGWIGCELEDEIALKSKKTFSRHNSPKYVFSRFNWAGKFAQFLMTKRSEFSSRGAHFIMSHIVSHYIPFAFRSEYT